MQNAKPDHAQKIRELESLVPLYNEHLNEIRFLFTRLEKYFEATEILKININSTELHEIKNQLNFSGFINVCILDLLVTTKNLLRASDIWEEIYYLRHGYLTIYESINTYNKHNRRIWSLVSTKYTASKSQFEIFSQLLKGFKKNYDYEGTIAEIRNETTAHIDDNFVAYFQRISNFDTNKAIEALLSFTNVLRAMQNLSREISHQTGIILKEKANEVDASIQAHMNAINEKFEYLNQYLNLK